MRRLGLTPRGDWQAKVEAAGLTYHTLEDGRPYWDEAAAYEFSAAEVDTLEAAGNRLQEMCLAAAQHIIDEKRYAELGIPEAAIAAIEWAWEHEPPAIYGRFDVSWAGAASGEAPKLLEYNADTPTSLLEAAVVQWRWLREVRPHADQFNSLHEKLIAKWKDVDAYLAKPVYFASLGNAEDQLTTIYLRDTAEQAGLKTASLPMVEIGWNEHRQAFMDLDEEPMFSIFKLYPWEAMLAEEFGVHALATYRSVRWIEPIWKMLLSNKGILPVLWELYSGHENLLEAHFDSPVGLTSYVRKPLISREGANISLVRPFARPIETDGPYGGGRTVCQALTPEAVFAGAEGPRYPVLGLWMIDQECCGMGIRESAGPITDNLSSFVPHYF